ncbi:type I-C CRISPR-associated endonuclease Cas1c [Clostridium sp. C105KSO13]|uniref:type I-C CRISPR-associated endonuclease Cas1c n=1 Tax=Clostridium sp. C105KSO13 TaxID=1776045 RepID=UPI0007405D59|nr:type I-C CRISPR-associated endonuclease Cas1c [Clostridium sp. C105KSO13]CUX17710.1 CRISPR-associated endonuclease Cas1 [Clostridium sp. C105KSO13]
MKKLLNTLYITSTNRYLSLDGENVVILEGQEEIGRVPLHNLEGIVTFGYTGASPALMGACAQRNIGLTFMSGNGRFLARISGEVRGNVTLRKQQYQMSENKEKSIEVARNCITGKLYNSRWILERAARDYPMRLDTNKIKEKSAFLGERLKDVRTCKDSGNLLGIEGEGASVYFSVFDDLILQQKDKFHFQGRNRRPPLDSVNAMLSFAYSLLAGMCASALETVGLDPYVGFFHTDRPGRVSLALDMMEELRGVMADRFVLTMINKRIIDDSGFLKKESGAVIMDDDTRKIFLAQWQNKKKETITHPFLGEKIEWGIVPHAQAMLLARHIRGDLDEYPPFLWK